jgi:hypothetical protein
MHELLLLQLLLLLELPVSIDSTKPGSTLGRFSSVDCTIHDVSDLKGLGQPAAG